MTTPRPWNCHDSLDSTRFPAKKRVYTCRPRSISQVSLAYSSRLSLNASSLPRSSAMRRRAACLALRCSWADCNEQVSEASQSSTTKTARASCMRYRGLSVYGDRRRATSESYTAQVWPSRKKHPPGDSLEALIRTSSNQQRNSYRSYYIDTRANLAICRRTVTLRFRTNFKNHTRPGPSVIHATSCKTRRGIRYTTLKSLVQFSELSTISTYIP